jgi:ADP-ribose pyrophosphatase YjhB (NUDIX family)
MHANFCSNCGGMLKPEFIEGRQRGRCTNCRCVHYEQLIVGAGALLEANYRLLLICRAHDPFKGLWGLPAGHVEADEPPEAAAIREAEEETGIKVSSKGLFGAYFFDDHPKGCGIFLVYRCCVLGGNLSETAEAKNPTFFPRAALPEQLAGGGHSKAILSWKDTPPSV